MLCCAYLAACHDNLSMVLLLLCRALLGTLLMGCFKGESEATQVHTTHLSRVLRNMHFPMTNFLCFV